MFDLYDNDFEKAFDEAVDAIEKKEHRLIWADALKRHYAWWEGGTLAKTLDEMKRDFDTIIDLQPTVEVEPTKRGRWERYGAIKQGTLVIPIYRCSECKEDTNNWFRHYCPHCGAKMDGVDDV